MSRATLRGRSWQAAVTQARAAVGCAQVSASGPAWIDAIRAHAGRLAAFARLSLPRPLRSLISAIPAGPVSGATKEVPVAVLAGFW
jgi:hypothetical protein